MNEGAVRRRTALLSVGAAVLLVAVKLVTGLVTGSLAFIAEAVHSGTDLVAALLTLYAVRVAIRPPDRDHQYGHGKAEHLAALGESAFLILVSVAIAAESLRRLITGEGHGVDAAWWAFAVLAVVIALDASRAIASRRAARRFKSPAFASNALHFASDLAGSVAVLVGMIFVAAGEPSADAAAALFVAALVIAAGLRLARQSVDVLMDRAEVEAEQRIRSAIGTLHQPLELRRIRVRQAAGRHFADLVLAVPPDAGVTQAHAVADEVERAVEEALPGADIVVHVEPNDPPRHDLRERATADGSPAATKIIPTSTATEPARSEAKRSALDANAGELNRWAARRLAIAREASRAITTASTTNAHQVASTPCPSPAIRRRSDSAPIATDTRIRNALSPSAARCSALPWPYW